VDASVHNVLFIMCDQLRHDALSCAGGLIDTPNIDALADRGVRFDRAFAQGSVCGSSRMSAYTGRYVQSHGSRYNSVPLSVAEPTIGDHLRPLGVRSVLIGKTHMARDRSGLDRLRLDPDDPWTTIVNQCGFEPIERDDGLVPNTRPQLFERGYNRFLVEQGYDGPNPWHTAANSVLTPDGERMSGWLLEASQYPAIIPDELSETAYMTNRAIDFIRDAGDDRWCIHLSFIKPHWPYVVSEPYHRLVHRNDLPSPNRCDAELETAHPVLRAFQRSRIGSTFSRDEVRTTVYPAYLGLVKQLDDHLGRLFRALHDLGRSDDTMIVLTSDHGDYLGDHWMGEKDWLHEEVVRIPMIVADPRAGADATRGSVSTDLVEMIDLAPTFVDALGGDAGANVHLEGQSLEPLLHDRAAAADDHDQVAVTESEFSLMEMVNDLPPGPRASRRATMLRTPDYKYILSETGPNLLYNLREEPAELTDRIGDPGLAPVRAELHERLFEWYRARSHELTWRPGDGDVPRYEGKDAVDGILIGYWNEADVPDAARPNIG